MHVACKQAVLILRTPCPVASDVPATWSKEMEVWSLTRLSQSVRGASMYMLRSCGEVK